MSLSGAQREILVKACLQDIPLYFMSSFKLPNSMCGSMVARMIRFWWKGGKKEKSIHWVCKDFLLKTKSEGTLGFRCFESLNNAMLMKLLW